MSTATETVATVDRIAGDLAEVVRQRAELEALRSAIVLDGGDLDAFSDRLSRLEQKEKTLRAGLAAAEAAHEVALSEERIGAIEAEAKAAREKLEPALVGEYLRLAAAAQEVNEAGEMMGALEREIERINDRVREVGRDDLVRSPSATRADVLRELGGLAPDDVAADTVVRNGASDDEHYGRVRAKLEERAKARPSHGELPWDFLRREPGADFAKRAFLVCNEGEDDASYEARLVESVARHLNVSPFLDMAGTVGSSPEESAEAYRRRVWDAAAKKLRVKRAGEGDEAFARRQLRARMKATAKVDASDQLAPLTARAVETLQKYGLGMDAAQIKRENPRPISGRSLYGRNVLTDVNAQFLYSQRFAEQLRRRQERPEGT